MRWIGAALTAAVLVAGCGAPLPPASPDHQPPTSVGSESLSADGTSGASTSPHADEAAAGTTGVPNASASADRTQAPGGDPPATDGAQSPVPAPDVAAVLALLHTLPVKGRAPKTGYDRALFGPAWSDDVTVDGGHNGCDTRNDILRRDLTGAVVKAGTYGCLVLSGTLHDAYTGRTIAFTRGQVTSQAVQIDHVVALMDAWQKGAQQLSTAERRNLANDPLNLQAVDGPTNERKGAGDAATWLPPNKGYRCVYVSRQVQVKATYRLWVTLAERDAVERVLASCAMGVTPSTTPVESMASTGVTPATTRNRVAAPTMTTVAAPATATVAAPVAAAVPGDCFPRSSAGNCYRAGQLCAKASHGTSGVASNGRAITCADDDGIWRWTYA